ncbi:MAG: Lrp/AsnC family transcriptional regulator [Candidatus Helarchaeota archaeon]|nr:Lrp/AsnC family transcriptional regulator [Candidatus Helarchaeota archaeon]
MKNEINIDEIDKRIIMFLKKDAKISLQDIAAEVGKTENTIRRRIKTLEDKGIISGYTIRISLPKKKSKIKTFLRIDSNISKTRDIAYKLSQFPEIEHIYFMSGECGIWAVSNFVDIPHLDKFLENHISKVDGIKRIINCIILNEFRKEKDEIFQ